MVRVTRYRATLAKPLMIEPITCLTECDTERSVGVLHIVAAHGKQPEQEAIVRSPRSSGATQICETLAEARVYLLRGLQRQTRELINQLNDVHEQRHRLLRRVAELTAEETRCGAEDAG